MIVLDVFNLPPTKGEVGIEIEVEGENLPVNIPGWYREYDGSLRGESCEYVVQQPCLRTEVSKITNAVTAAYKEADTLIDRSTRTSVHVHINVQEMSMTQVYNFILLFLILEEALVSFCGKSRVNNLFCLRSGAAEGLLTTLESCANPARAHLLGGADVKYAAINVAALGKFGSLEFRSMRGTKDMRLIQKWVRMLLSLKDAALVYSNPIQIVEDFSIKGCDLWLDTVLGRNAGVVNNRRGWDEELFDSMRNVQSIAYSGDWDGLSREVV